MVPALIYSLYLTLYKTDIFLGLILTVSVLERVLLLGRNFCTEALNYWFLIPLGLCDWENECLCFFKLFKN